LAINRVNGDTNARPDVNRVSIKAKGLAERSGDFLRGHRRTIGAIQVGQDNGKFIAAQPSRRFRLAHAGAQSLSRLLEQPIAGGMAQGVIDIFEVIEVDQQHGQEPAGTVCAAQCLEQGVAEESAIGQTGQRVVESEPLRPFFGVPPLHCGSDRGGYSANKMDVVGHNRPRLGAPGFENANRGLIAPDRNSDRTDDPAFTKQGRDLKALLHPEIMTNGRFSGSKCMSRRPSGVGRQLRMRYAVVLPTGGGSHRKDIARGQPFHDHGALCRETVGDDRGRLPQ
jgi:hypothetical protein